MRPIWSGAISFGLINIPIQLYSGTKEHRVSLDMLHKKDLSPIRYAKICKEEEREVAFEDIVKGYEYKKGEYVVITDEDFEKVNPKKSTSIDLICFADESDIESIYFDKPYIVSPGKGSAKVYALLQQALMESKKVGVATFVMHNKEHLVVLKAYQHAIILQTLRFQTEIRDFRELELPVTKISQKELKMAMELIEQLTEEFKPETFKDNYAKEFDAMIQAKLKGVKEPAKKHKKEVEGKEIPDITEKLKESLKKFKTPQKSIKRRKARV